MYTNGRAECGVQQAVRKRGCSWGGRRTMRPPVLSRRLGEVDAWGAADGRTQTAGWCCLGTTWDFGELRIFCIGLTCFAWAAYMCFVVGAADQREVCRWPVGVARGLSAGRWSSEMSISMRGVLGRLVSCPYQFFPPCYICRRLRKKPLRDGLWPSASSALHAVRRDQGPTKNVRDDRTLSSHPLDR